MREKPRTIEVTGADLERLLDHLDDLAEPESPGESRDLLWDLAERVGTLVGMAPADLDPARPLTVLGLDSLSAVELQHGLATGLGVEVELADLLAGWSLDDLAREVRVRLAGTSGERPDALPAEVTGTGTGDFPLSHGQRGLWFLDRLASSSAAYHIVAAARVRGALDATVLERAFEALVVRHPALRTTFHDEGGEPFQRVAASGGVDFSSIDATTWEEERVAGYLAAQGYRPFDLQTGPLLRVRLLWREPGDHTVLLAVHHLVSDFASLAVMVRELSALYRGETALLALPATYGDFVRRQEELLAGPAGERQWRYWRAELAGELPVLDFPADRARPASPTHLAVAAALPAPIALAGLRDLGRRQGATLYMTLLAAFQALLHRYTGEADLLVGSPTAGRSVAAWAGLVGYFVNTLVLRSDLAGDPPFSELLGRVRAKVLAALAHADLPLALLAERLRPSREGDRPPLVQALFALEKGERPGEEPLAAFALGMGGARFALADLAVEALPIPGRRSQFEVTLTAAELGGGLAAVFELAADRFDPTTARRLAGHFATLLAGIVERPDERVGSLPLLTLPERAQLRTEWNATAGVSAAPATPAVIGCLHERFAVQARRTPGATAVVGGSEHLSYGELDTRGDCLARRLRALGVGPEAPVGFALDRSPTAVLGIFAVWKSGGALLPLDPHGPRERTAFLLADAGAVLLLTLRRFQPDLPDTVPVLCLDDDAPAGSVDETAPHRVTPDHLAWVLYTSGSTGTPKGVLVRHGSVVHLIEAVREAILGGASGPLAVGLLAAWVFDPALEQVLYLLSGDTLHLLSEDARRDGAALLADLTRHPRLDLVDATPPQLRLWLEAGLLDQKDLLPRRLLVGGEAMVEATWRLLAESGTTAWNLYGPTECTVDATACRVRADLAGVRIGRPLPNVGAHVLDRRLAPLPIGVPGELVLGGPGVARGYLGRPSLTAERFVPDPFASDPGGRLYRTGDRVRIAADGNLEFLGRLDLQLKLRGVRIEPGEIEAALCALPGIAAAAVLARGPQGAEGETRLVAYLAKASPGLSEIPSVGLRSALAGRLPEAMIPATFVFLDSLPLTAQGKVDRGALAALPLPAPAPAPRGSSVFQDAPILEVLAVIWRELLGVGATGGDDNFFALGGHSLLATRLLARVRSAFGVDLPLSDLFTAPSLAGFAARVEAGLKGGAPGLPPPVPVGRELPLPLSHAQERLWFLDRLEPGSAAYVMPAALRLRGSLLVAVLAAALSAIVRRHEALRTVFALADGGEEPVQVLAPPPAAAHLLPVADLAGLPGAPRRREAARLQAEEAGAAFDLARGPLYRFRLLALQADEHVFLATFHHAVFDGASTEILGQELSALYRAFAAGRSAPLPALSLQYADWAVWQRRWLAGPAGESDLGWWKERLGGAPTDLGLPYDRPADRPADKSAPGRSAARSLALRPPLAAALVALARGERATLFMTLAAGWAALLSRLAGVEDLLLGTPVANRRAPEVLGLIGFFVNTLPLRSDLSGRPGLRQLVLRTRAAVLGLHAHQDVPLERLVEALQPERSPRRDPLFQAVFALEEPPLSGLDLPGLTAELLPAASGMAGPAKFDLLLTVRRSGEGLAAELEHAAARFDGTTAGRWLAAFATLLAGMMAEPERPFTEIALLSPAERHQLAAEWNDTAVALAERSLGEAFERQVRRAPEAVAVADGPLQVTYGELARRSRRLARRLARQGVGPETPVGLAIERSIELIVGMLAVIEAGGFYVPLDPGYPRERRDLLLRESGAWVVLTAGDIAEPAGDSVDFAATPSWPPPSPTLPLSRGRDPRPSLSEAKLSPIGGTPHSDSLACLIHTSGSTGVPKGVAVPHRAIRRLIEGANYVRLTPADRVAQASTPVFDAATFEIWGALLTGARLVVLPPGALSLAELGREVRRSGVTVLWLTAGLFHPMIESQADDLVGVEQLLAGGDVLSPAHVARARRLLPGCWLVNGYGPTEGTTFTCCEEIGEIGGLPPWASVPIGRPISNTTARVLDGELQAVPIGVAGELCAGGLGLARGYRGDPARTAERFVPDPLGADPGRRLYRTGDRARLLTDGRLEFLGRRDRQVKVRGFRVEPGEVEAALATHPAVRQAAVEARPERPEITGGRRLVAWVVGEVPAGELRSYLLGKLPEPAVPSAFVFLPALPLTARGKVDRQALSEGDEEREEGAAPSTPFEEVLAAIWAEVLGRERVGTTEDFFALGGHSLLATRVVARVRSAFGVEIPLSALFEAPTVTALAVRIEEALREERGASAGTPPPLVAAPREGDLPLSFAQERLWFLDQLEPASPFYNIAGAVRLTGALSVPALAASLAGTVARHEALRTAFPARDGAPVQVVSPPPSFFPLRQVDLERLPEEPRDSEVRRLAAAEAARPFDLARGPLLRATLLGLHAGPGSLAEHALLFTLHHIVGDGWSMAVLLREVGALYGGFVAGRPAALPALPVQYADFALWQRRWLNPQVVERELAHWRAVLPAGLPVLDLPLDRPRPARQSFHGAEIALGVPPAVAAALAALARSRGATPFMTFLAAFALLLSRHTGAEELTVGTPVAHRGHRETEGLIGFFVNTLVLRADVAGDPTFPALLDRVRRMALDAYAHQDLPFERLVGELAPGRDLSHHPLFQVLFSLEEPLLGATVLPGLASAPIEIPDPTAKIDLSLVLTPLSGEDHGGFRATFGYGRDLFDRTTVARLAGHFAILLEGLAADPQRPLSRLPLLAAAELHQLRAEWNDTASGPPDGTCLHDLVARRGARYPDALAVEMEGSFLSYGELCRAANRLAHHLRALGVERESPVAVLLSRRPEMLVALLAISQAGGVYLPLAPTYPRQRLALLLEESAPAVLLTEEGLLADLPEHAARVVCLDRAAERAALAALPASAPPPLARPEDLAYLIYTSGSTGTPKAAMIEYRNLACFLRALPGTLMTGEGDTVPSWAPVTFDLSLIEWCYALATGGRVLLVPEDRVLDLPALAATLARASSLVAVPALMRQIVLHLEETGTPGPWAGFRNVSAGGDSASGDLLEGMRRVFPRAVVRNIYGPTETTMLCTAYRVPPEGPVRGDVIGRPMGDTVLQLLDRAGKPVPIGVPGELWIGGGGVGRGYLKRPELTARHFVEREGRRFFRSGDLARHLPDGNLLFLGRLDTQVKLRGLRIELGEIEAALLALPPVAEAAVALRQDGGEKRLVAYVVPRPGERPESLEAGELRRSLAERLPEAMVPAVFVVLAALPRNAHGKLDRQALPAPERRPMAEAAPRTPLERSVAAVWEEILGIERVGIDDNFFELGGNSLLLVRLRSRLAQTLGRDVAVVDLFQHTTIRALAEHLSRAEGAAPVHPDPQAADLARTQARRESLARMKERRGRPR